MSRAFVKMAKVSLGDKLARLYPRQEGVPPPPLGDEDPFANLPMESDAKGGDIIPKSVYEMGFRDDTLRRRFAHVYQVEHKEAGLEMQFGPLLARNPPQLALSRLIHKRLHVGGAIRIIVLKGRKVGTSTLTLLWWLELAQQLGWSVGCCSHAEKSCEALYRIPYRAWFNSPENDRVPLKNWTDGELMEFGSRSVSDRHNGVPGMKGRIEMRTAKGSYPFTSDTIRALHLSECGKYDVVGGIEKQMRFIASCVGAMPPRGPSIVIAESTANGKLGWFPQTWELATAKDSPDEYGQMWIPVFIGFLEDPSCRLPVPPRYDWADWDPGDKDREEWMAREKGATPEQLYFRRFKLRNDYALDFDLFDQEFPVDAESAFIGSGRPGIHKSLLDAQTGNLSAPTSEWDYHIEDQIQPMSVEWEGRDEEPSPV